MTHLTGRKILIVATDGFEQSELEVTRDRLKEHNAIVEIAAPKGGMIRGWKDKNWGDSVPVDKTLDQVDVASYDAIVLPGGVMNPDKLRTEQKAIDLIEEFYRQGKVIAAICHAPWLLIEAGIVEGRRVTSFKSLRTDMENAGAEWEDSEVVADDGIVTSRNPGDLEAFSRKIMEEVLEGAHERRAAA
jgi:protease I